MECLKAATQHLKQTMCLMDRDNLTINLKSIRYLFIVFWRQNISEINFYEGGAVGAGCELMNADKALITNKKSVGHCSTIDFYQPKPSRMRTHDCLILCKM